MCGTLINLMKIYFLLCKMGGGVGWGGMGKYVIIEFPRIFSWVGGGRGMF